jgi:flagellin-specific chaperone FliS
MNADTEAILSKLTAEVLGSMREYMRQESASYEETDIRRCAEILEELNAALATATGRAEALAHVRQAVLSLNALKPS